MTDKKEEKPQEQDMVENFCIALAFWFLASICMEIGWHYITIFFVFVSAMWTVIAGANISKYFRSKNKCK